MLAGLLIATLLVAGVAFAVPWISAQRQSADELAEEPTERFSQSMRILTRDAVDMGDPSAVSTPLTRAADYYGLHMTAKQAARRRLTVLTFLASVALVLGVLAGFGIVPWWSFLIPVGLIGIFLTIARFSVVAMHRNLDAYAQDLELGFDDDEDTVTIDLNAGSSESTEFSVDLSAPSNKGVFWDPVPVAQPTYVSKPLMPRTVRTIDLSAPTVSTPLIPTAEHPDEIVDEASMPLRHAVGE